MELVWVLSCVTSRVQIPLCSESFDDFVRWPPFVAGLNGPPSCRLASFDRRPLPQASLASFTAYAAASPPPTSQTILNVAGILSATDTVPWLLVQSQSTSGGRLCAFCRLWRTRLVTLCAIEKFCRFVMYSFIPSSYLYSITASLVL